MFSGTAMLAVVVAWGSAWAQNPPANRPSEQEMFGGPAQTPAQPQTPPPAQTPPQPPGQPPAPPPPSDTQVPTPGQVQGPGPPGAVGAEKAVDVDRDKSLLGGESAPQHLSDYQAPENPLQIGGQIYLRAQTTALQSEAPDRWTLSAPSLLDLYVDARPNPRVRAFALGRMSYDPTAAPGGAASPASGTNVATNGAFVGGTATGFTTFNASRGPNVILDQMWIRFDVESRVFVTAGKQHVHWGTGRFWQPTDYLHPVKRNPLDVFDARAGTSMLKLHIPWEERGWNFYAFAVTEDPNIATNTLRGVAGAGRAELVLGGVEVGLDALVKRDQDPRFGIDFSTGVWDFDVYGDAAIRSGSDFAVVQRVPGADQGVICTPAPGIAPGAMVNDLSSQYHVSQLTGVKAQVVGGINWSRKYNDNDMFVLGAEYFYNQPGYSDTSLYPGLLFNDAHTPLLNFFYTGRNYGALFASFPAPYSWNYTTFTLSTLGNLSDLSFVSRLDYAVTILTHLSVEAFVAVHYGSRNGEFRLGFDIPAQYAVHRDASGNPVTAADGSVMCDLVAPPVTRDPALFDLGIALRLKI